MTIIKDTKFEQHYKMIADNSALEETYVLKFKNDPLEWVGIPAFEQLSISGKEETFELKIVGPDELDGEKKTCDINEIEYMRKEIPEKDDA